MNIELIVHPGSEGAFIAWTSPFVPECRGFALWRRIKRGPHSATSPNTQGEPDAEGFVTESVASWVGFANGPDAPPGTREPTTTWPIQKYLWSDFAVHVGDTVAYHVMPMIGASTALQEALISDRVGALLSLSDRRATERHRAISTAVSSRASGSRDCCRHCPTPTRIRPPRAGNSQPASRRPAIGSAISSQARCANG